jgi:hypothetical protein
MDTAFTGNEIPNLIFMDQVGMTSVVIWNTKITSSSDNSEQDQGLAHYIRFPDLRKFLLTKQEWCCLANQVNLIS